MQKLNSKLTPLIVPLISGDELHIADFNPDDPYAANQIQGFQFADGTVLSYSQLIDLGFDLDGTAGDDRMRWRIHAAITNIGKAANDETTNVWRVTA